MIDNTHPKWDDYSNKFSELMAYCSKEMGWLPEAKTEEATLIKGQALLVMDELCRRLARLEALAS